MTTKPFWLGRAFTLPIKPATPEAKRLARGAMASFWSQDNTWPPAITLETVFELGHNVPELHVSYIYSN